MNQASFKYYIWILESNGTYFIPYICQNQYSNLGYSAGTLLGSSSRGGAVTGILVGTLLLPIKASHCAISGQDDYSLFCILAAQIWTSGPPCIGLQRIKKRVHIVQKAFEIALQLMLKMPKLSQLEVV